MNKITGIFRTISYCKHKLDNGVPLCLSELVSGHVRRRTHKGRPSPLTRQHLLQIIRRRHRLPNNTTKNEISNQKF